MEKGLKNQAKKLITKFMASSLIVTLTCTNFLVCGNYFVTYATEGTVLDKQTDATLSKNVKFDAYFEAEGNKTHYKTADLNGEGVELVLSTQVKNDGYLKNATIDLKNAENKNDINYTISDLDDASAIVQSASENQLVLRQINAGDAVTFKAMLEPSSNGIIDVEKLNSNNKIILKGLYIDEKGQETPIEKEIEINLGWTGKYEAEIEQRLIKYIPLESEEGNKTLVSMQIETGLKEQKFMLPIKETKVEIQVPVINGERPNSVTVNAISTQATNGLTSEKLMFTEENWKYSDSEAKITIQVQNENKNLGANKDIYIVNYIYSEKVYELLEQETVSIDADSKVTIQTYSNNAIEETSASTKQEVELDETLGKLISLSGEPLTEKIAKGKFYANINNPQSNDNTEYEYKWNINVGYTDGLAGITIQDKQEKFTESHKVNGKLKGKTIYKQIVFSASAFDELLGEDGKVSIYDGQDKLLALVAKDTRTDNDGNYLVELLEEVSEIKMITSKPVKSGNLVISVKKEIKSDLEFSKSQIDSFEALAITSEISQIDEKTNEEIAVEEKTISIPLEATVTKSQISINKEKLSTLVKNENVEITIELGNDNETSDLYIDPIFEIELPQCVTNVEIVESKILFDEELLIDNVEFIQKNGIPMLRVMLKGVQTKYSSGVVTNGTNIVIKTNVVVNNLTPTSTEEIKMYYYNSNTVNYENGVQTDKGLGGLATANIEFVAPTGMLTINSMEKFNDNGDILISVNQGDLMQQIVTYRPARIAKMRLLAINNTGNMCSDVVLLGRIPFAGNKDIETGADLGTTIDTYLRSFIKPINIQGEGIKIYYSENGEATTAIADETNGWTDAPTDISKMKSYMIVLEGYEIEQGQAVEFTYDFEIPANIGYNHTINSTFGIYYVNNTQVATVSAFEKADKVGITTGTGPELNVTQIVEGADEEGKIDTNNVLKYIITVSNEGTEAATDVTIQNEIPKWSNLVRNSTANPVNIEFLPEELDENTMKEWNVAKVEGEGIDRKITIQWTIDSIKPQETITKEVYIMPYTKPDIYTYYKNYPGFTIDENGKYYITTSKYNPETETSYEEKNEINSVPEIELENIVLVGASNVNAILKSSSDSVDVRETNIVVEEISDLDGATKIAGNKEINFTIAIVNNGENIVNNIFASKVLPEELEYVSSEVQIQDEEGNKIGTKTQGEYNEATREIKVNIEELNNTNQIIINITAKTKKLEQGVYEKDVSTTTTVKKDSEILASGETIKFQIVKPQYTITQECTNTSTILNEGDEIEYRLKIKNIGNVEIYGMFVDISIPECFKVKEAYYENNTGTTKIERNSLKKITEIIGLDKGETVIFTITTRVQKVKEDTKVTTNAVTYGDGLESMYTDVIFQTVERALEYINNENENNGNSGNNSGNTDNNITIERKYKVSGNIWLDKNENGEKELGESLLKDISIMAINANTREIVTETLSDENGKYLLTNIPEGKYILIFKYDNKVYTATDYLKTGISEIHNSNAIEKEIIINNEKMVAGVTDIVEVNSTKTNINLGLISKEKFDLKLEKGITKVAVQNKEGVKEYTFEGSKLAKVEIPTSQVARSLVIVEYTIRIINEGNVAGYAKNIVDYKPKDLSFNSSLNPNWYEGNDGNVYTTVLENTIINPGETKEIKLLLTKQMTENNSGMSNNVSEIKESYNEKGIQDKDSIAGNNAQGEDDRDTADLIIAPKTGETVMYTALTIAILTIFITGIYLIKRTNILKGKEVYK